MNKGNRKRAGMNRQGRFIVAAGFTVGYFTLCAISAQADSSTEFQFGGYIKLDIISSRYSDGDLAPASIGRDFYVPGLTPVGGADEGRDTDFHAKETRINLKTSTDIEGHKLLGFVELDFLTGNEGDERVSNSYKPRVRHAYFVYDNWLFGQTWSTFQNVAALAENLDFVGPSEGTVFERQAMVRYSRGNWQFALENPETTVSPFGGSGRIVTDDGLLPDLVVRYTLPTDIGNWVVAAILRQLDYEDSTSNIDDSESAFGISVSAKLQMYQQDDLRFMLTGGTGLGRYLGLNLANGAVIDESGNLEAIDSMAGLASYRHFWSEKWRSNFTYSLFIADNDRSLIGTSATEESQSIHVNLLYSPVKNITIGGELIKARRELESGANGELDRIQFSAKYEL